MIGAVLAGGASRRMGGRPKAFADLGGRPLVAWALDAVRAAGLDPVVVGLEVPGVATCPEPEVGTRHPARGIAAAVAYAGAPVVVVACDLPFVPPGLLAWLGGQPDDAVTVAGQPLIGRYADAQRLRAAALAGTPLQALPRREVDPAPWGDPVRIRFNVNTPEDLRAARRCVAASRRPPDGAR